eukprot:gene22040-26718_t
MRLAQGVDVRRVQIDFEVKASERQILRDVVTDVRAALPPDTQLSMTALASWCAHETWFEDLPIDEIAPMLFRMGPGGEQIRSDLARGGDFSSTRCRSALAVSMDAPILRAPVGRRIYLFSPRSWTQGDFERVIGRLFGPAATCAGIGLTVEASTIRTNIGLGFDPVPRLEHHVFDALGQILQCIGLAQKFMGAGVTRATDGFDAGFPG